ncbi:hypothetical protein HETIRDRAFT_449689 [Heterobasidion irregulare TC 32-1]|uniref:Uncharacterized protein n=1 Tax=Heterobasidion irregulare (strain TC 32-1) TaxID=747525 RepID=W4KE83_HETIT|nr:uncharacterized protein HETIRDRAFT_449689 [Heterobasidion irregulare TC 32-1]ETW84123.1 hypothetical protein HETIRDRAFT_449689 [Heterobasidion irregulare TC 32-1]
MKHSPELDPLASCIPWDPSSSKGLIHCSILIDTRCALSTLYLGASLQTPWPHGIRPLNQAARARSFGDVVSLAQCASDILRASMGDPTLSFIAETAGGRAALREGLLQMRERDATARALSQELAWSGAARPSLEVAHHRVRAARPPPAVDRPLRVTQGAGDLCAMPWPSMPQGE